MPWDRKVTDQIPSLKAFWSEETHAILLIFYSKKPSIFKNSIESSYVTFTPIISPIVTLYMTSTVLKSGKWHRYTEQNFICHQFYMPSSVCVCMCILFFHKFIIYIDLCNYHNQDSNLSSISWLILILKIIHLHFPLFSSFFSSFFFLLFLPPFLISFYFSPPFFLYSLLHRIQT